MVAVTACDHPDLLIRINADEFRCETCRATLPVLTAAQAMSAARDALRNPKPKETP